MKGGAVPGAAVIFFAAFAFYAATAYPSVSPRDGMDLGYAARTLTLAHAPGYPLYAIAGKAWATALGLGEFSYRLNLLSAAGGAGAAALAALCAGGPGGWVGAAALTVSAPLWKFSLLQEKYSWHALFAAALFLLSLGTDATRRRRLALSGLLLGLGLVNHQTLLLLLPALAILWRGKVERPGTAALLVLLGLGPMLMLWIRLGDLSQAWAMAVRAQYGTFELHPAFARAWSWDLAAAGLAFFFKRLPSAVGWPALALAAAGAVELWRRDRRKAAALGAAFFFSGPFFILLSRFDPSNWVASSALEPCFLIPVLALCVAAGHGANGLLEKFSTNPAMIRTGAAALGLALAVWGGARSASRLDRREDFSAYDYSRDLDRSLPPGSAVAAAGDTARFGLRYRSLEGGDKGRLLAGSDERLGPEWAAAQVKVRPLYAVGLSARSLESLGLWGNPFHLSPEGLVQAVRAGPGWERDRASWERLALRRPPDGEPEERDSYLRDVLFSHAFAHYLSGQIHEVLAGEKPPYSRSSRHYLEAGALDPLEYRVQMETFR